MIAMNGKGTYKDIEIFVNSLMGCIPTAEAVSKAFETGEWCDRPRELFVADTSNKEHCIYNVDTNELTPVDENFKSAGVLTYKD